MSFIAVGIGVGAAATVASAAVSMSNAGNKPSVPNAPTVDLAAQQQQAIASNQASLPQAEALTGQANLFNQQQITQMLNSVIPNYSGISQSSSANIEAMLKGQIPNADVQSQELGSVAKSFSGGFGGSGMQGNLVARDLGISQLNLSQQGLNSAQSWISSMAKMYEPGMGNVQSMFITPQQQAAQANQNANNTFQQQWMSNQISAMPNPQMTALSGLLGGVGSSMTGGLGGLGAAAGGAGGGLNSNLMNNNLMANLSQNAADPLATSWWGAGGGGGGGQDMTWVDGFNPI